MVTEIKLNESYTFSMYDFIDGLSYYAVLELFGNLSFRTNSAKNQQNAVHFAKTCSITNRVSEQVHCLPVNIFPAIFSPRNLNAV
jgi:hypothetical protein